MAIDSVPSTSVDLTASYGTKTQREQQEVQPAQRDVAPDNDSDDKRGRPSQPTLNSYGQTVGTLINTKA